MDIVKLANGVKWAILVNFTDEKIHLFYFKFMENQFRDSSQKIIKYRDETILKPYINYIHITEEYKRSKFLINKANLYSSSYENTNLHKNPFFAYNLIIVVLTNCCQSIERFSATKITKHNETDSTQKRFNYRVNCLEIPFPRRVREVRGCFLLCDWTLDPDRSRKRCPRVSKTGTEASEERSTRRQDCRRIQARTRGHETGFRKNLRAILRCDHALSYIYNLATVGCWDPTSNAITSSINRVSYRYARPCGKILSHRMVSLVPWRRVQ